MAATKRIFILLAHPNTESLTCAMADRYEKAALEAGHEVRRLNIGEMRFDPVLHKGYKEIQALEPDLHTFQDNVKWSDHLVILYPNWWGTMPALLKGLIDRAWLPGFAFRFHKTGLFKGLLWTPLLAGKTARIVILANTHPLVAMLLFGDFTNELKRATLGFAGVRSAISIFAPSERASSGLRDEWFRTVDSLGRRGV